MEKTIALYYAVDDTINRPFPNAEEQAEATSFTYDASRMSGAPSLSFTIKHSQCLDSLWNESVYAEFNGERYYVRSVPTSKFDSGDSRYIHDVMLVSERAVLDNVYFFDVVYVNPVDDKPVSNSSNVTFFGDIKEFARRLQLSLRYSNLDYVVHVDDGVESEAKLLSFNDQFFSNVLQEIYNTFNLPYYFSGKTIHIGSSESEIEEIFEYGANNSLVSIQKQNANYKIINRCTGDGSDKNIPYYYPNQSPYGKLKALYNGSESSLLAVNDWAKFSKYGPSSRLIYEVVTSTSADKNEVATLSDFEGKLEYSSTILGQHVYAWVGECKLSITQAWQTVYLSFGFTEITGGNISFSIIDSNGLEVAQTIVPTTQGMRLSYGDYTVKIRIGVGARPDADKQYVLGVAYATVYVSNTTNESAWRLNGGKNISLSAMGVHFAGSAKQGDEIRFEISEGRIPTSSKLMPYIYRDSKGEERFYNAINNYYHIPDSKGDTYSFSNVYTSGNPKEHIVHFEDICPTIKGMVNARNERLDMFTEIEYDYNDNDEIGEDGNYEHPYFYAKLRRFNGENGFNLFTHAIEGGAMIISMTSGSCGACQWTIGVDDKTQRNPVQVYEKDTIDNNGVMHKAGSLKRNDDGDVLWDNQVPQDIQNDTINNEVWIALKKDINTFGVIMPNASNQYKPSVDDTFVILNISLPDSYIVAAEKRLSEAIIKYMSENNDDKFNFSIKFSRIYLEEHPEVLHALTENSKIRVRYNGNVYSLYVSSYSYKMNDTDALPEVSVQITDTITVNRSVLQNTIEGLKSAEHHATYISESTGGNAQMAASRRYISGTVDLERDIYTLGQQHFVSKQISDSADGVKTFRDDVFIGKGISSTGFNRGVFGGTGWGIYSDEQGRSIAEFDKLIARGELEVNEVKINQATFQKGTQVVSNGGCEVESVEEFDDYFRCYYINDNGTQFSGFVIGDQARCQRFDESYNNIVKSYWRLVVGVSASYVDLSKTDHGEDGVPEAGDTIVQLGNRSDTGRQNAILVSAYPYPTIVQYQGIDSYSLEDKIVTKITPNGNEFTGVMKLKAGSSGLADTDDFKKVQSDVEKVGAAAKLYTDTAIKGLQDQLDGKVESFFFDYDPTTSNLPASEWTTDELKEDHLNDTFTNTSNGRSWRWLEKDGTYQWVEIADTQSSEALAKAQEALAIANGKVTVFIEEPRSPYNKKDLWLQGEDGRIKQCIFTRATTGEFYPEDWINADDSHEYAEEKASEAEKNANENTKQTFGAIEYLKNAFGSAAVLDVDGISLASLIGVKNGDNLVAGLYGGSSKSLNDRGYADAEHGPMLMFGGIDGADKPESYKTAVFADGYLESDYFATARTGARVTIDNNQIRVFGSDGESHIFFGWNEGSDVPELQYIDSTGARRWYATSEGISNAVTIDTIQRIEAEKDFLGGIKIGGLPITKSASANNTIYLDANLVVSGAITMFGSGSTTFPTIWANIPFNTEHLSWDGSQWNVIVEGGSGSGGLDTNAVNVLISEYLTQNSYTTLSDISSALVGYATQGWVAGNYLSSSGGTISGDLSLNQYLRIKAWAGYGSGSCDMWYNGNNGILSITAQNITNYFGDAFIHSGNIGLYNAGSATKLATPRTIWGQSFDGTKNIDGQFDINGLGTLHRDDSALWLNYGGANNNQSLRVCGYDIAFYYGIGSNFTRAITITSDGDVAFGGTTADAKLHVYGNIITTGNIEGGIFGLRNSSPDNPLLRLTVGNQNYYVQATSDGIYLGPTSTLSLKVDANGNTTINGNLLTTGVITMFSQLSMKNVIDYDGLSLEQLSMIEPVRFTWKDGRDSFVHAGGIADEVMRVLPEVVHRTKDDKLTMDYGSAGFFIATSLIKPVIDHERRIADLERENAELRQKVERLSA